MLECNLVSILDVRFQYAVSVIGPYRGIVHDQFGYHWLERVGVDGHLVGMEHFDAVGAPEIHLA